MSAAVALLPKAYSRVRSLGLLTRGYGDELYDQDGAQSRRHRSAQPLLSIRSSPCHLRPRLNSLHTRLIHLRWIPDDEIGKGVQLFLGRVAKAAAPVVRMYERPEDDLVGPTSKEGLL